MTHLRMLLDARTLRRAERVIARHEPASYQNDHTVVSTCTFLRYLSRRLRNDGLGISR